MKVLVFMSDNRALDANIQTAQYNSLVAYINKAYCNAHGYDFAYVRTYYKDRDANTLLVCKDSTGTMRHASWAKLLAAQHCYNTMDYDYIVYIDSDCIFKDFSKSLESVVTDPTYSGVDIIFASNLPWHKLPCAGFFIVKVTDESKRFIKAWYNYKMPLYESTEWKNTLAMSKQYCSYDWKPDTHWEQDALWCMIANNIAIPYAYLEENSFYENNTQFLRHISHIDTHIRHPYFKVLVEKLTETHGSYNTIVHTIRAIELDTSSWDSS